MKSLHMTIASLVKKFEVEIPFSSQSEFVLYNLKPSSFVSFFNANV